MSQPHSPKVLARGKRSTAWACPWQVCSRCGLVYLNNPASVRAIRAPCPGRDDPADTPGNSRELGPGAPERPQGWR